MKFTKRPAQSGVNVHPGLFPRS